MKFRFSRFAVRGAAPFLLIGACVVGSPVWAATGIDSTNKYAWSENAGWANFGSTNGGVSVHFNGTNGYLTGYAWGENVGWVKLGVDAGGPYANDGAANWGVNLDTSSNLSGYAWCENAGWIKFASAFNAVTLDPATGEFSGYAWGENVGWLRFKGTSPDYGVRTESPLQLSSPTSVTASDGLYTNRIVVSWQASAGALGYTVWRNAVNDGSSAIWIAGTAVLSYDDTAITRGTRYYYWVKATNDYGSSAMSLSDDGYAQITPPLDVATSDGLYSRKTVTSWSASTGAVSYEVWRCSSNDLSSAQRIASNLTTVSYTDMDVSAGQTNYYWIRAENQFGGYSAFSSPDPGSPKALLSLPWLNLLLGP
jgi:hypothetical protein